MPTQFHHHHGDITKLKVQAIVNASNESGLGCQIPGHCIDSAIHFAAGPQLLKECHSLGGIPTTQAKLTRGYHLPCQYIIHVTGPDVKKCGENYHLLTQSYLNCLDLARKHNIRELAFCCISTGLFGFDKTKSARLAIQSVRTWMHQNPYQFEKIVFVTFTDEDRLIYQNLLHDNAALF